MSVRLQNRSSRSMIHTRFRLDLMVCSLSRKNQAEMEKKMTTPALPPLAMKNRKKISIASGSLLIGKPFWVIKWYIRIMNIAMMRSSSMLEFLCPPPPFAIRECAGAPCLAFMRLSFSASWFFLFTILLWSVASLPSESYTPKPTGIFY